MDSAPSGGSGASSQSTPLQRSVAVYVCDLAPDLTESDLRSVFGQYGHIVSITQADAPPEEAVIIEYNSYDAAEEAQRTVNQASIRGKTCRVLLVRTLELIRRSMVDGRRLVAESLDPAIEGQGLWDVFDLFGEVLDCKLQLDDGGRSKCVGFVHYAKEEDAAKAKQVLNNMQIGDTIVKARSFQWDDANLFTGTLYARMIYNPYMNASAGMASGGLVGVAGASQAMSWC